MSKPFALQIVLDLMQARADEATHQLARLIANERDAKNKLDLLKQYREEYAARFRRAAENGLGQREWHNYREFLNRLDEAIDSQLQTVATQAQNTIAGQTHWQLQRKNLKALDTLSIRHYSKEMAQEIRREQKIQDEIAIRGKDDKSSQ